MRPSAIKSDMLRYIVERGFHPGDSLPTIQQISNEMGVSVSKARESLEVARALGVVEIKPGRGTRVIDYDFSNAVTLSALYAIGQDGTHFEKLRQMRNELEIAFWMQAVNLLTKEDMTLLQSLVDQAQVRLARTPIQVPSIEHRKLHLTIFHRLDNPFVSGTLHAYWDAYDAFAPNLHVSLEYLRTVWDYHARIVEAIHMEDFETGRTLHREHMNLIRYRDPA